MAEELNPKNWSCAGYENVTTSDNVVHGQVKQAGNFVRLHIKRDYGLELIMDLEFYQNLQLRPRSM